MLSRYKISSAATLLESFLELRYYLGKALPNSPNRNALQLQMHNCVVRNQLMKVSLPKRKTFSAKLDLAPNWLIILSKNSSTSRLLLQKNSPIVSLPNLNWCSVLDPLVVNACKMWEKQGAMIIINALQLTFSCTLLQLESQHYGFNLHRYCPSS